jgi:tRNA 2-thiouridine synthesizing protein D
MTAFALMVLGAPASSQAPQTALAFARAALAGGHRVARVFFFQDGVRCADRWTVPAPGQTAVSDAWGELAREHGIDLVACVASAVKRGVLNDGERLRYGLAAANLHPAFDISGLGQWIDACAIADRVVVFGS